MNIGNLPAKADLMLEDLFTGIPHIKISWGLD